MANHAQRLGEGTNPVPLGSFCRLSYLSMAQSGRLQFIPGIDSELPLAWKNILARKSSVSARLNYL